MTDSVSHVLGNLQDAVARMALKLNEISALHQRMHYEDNYAAWDYCAHDNAPWPCETMRIVERVAL